MKTKQVLDALDHAMAIIGIEPAKRENEFTVNDFAKKSGLSKSRTRSFLREKVESKQLCSRKGVADGNSVTFYSLPK
jgi:hypothetical protein